MVALLRQEDKPQKKGVKWKKAKNRITINIRPTARLFTVRTLVTLLTNAPIKEMPRTKNISDNYSLKLIAM